MNTARWDLPALRAGGMVALVFGVPFSVAGSIVNSNHPDSPAAPWLALGAVLGFLVGAGCAAWMQRKQMPLAHGIVCAVLTYVIAQAVFITVKMIRGGEVRWMAAAFNLTAVLVAGLIGGMLGGMLHKRGMYPTAVRRAAGDEAEP